MADPRRVDRMLIGTSRRSLKKMQRVERCINREGKCWVVVVRSVRVNDTISALHAKIEIDAQIYQRCAPSDYDDVRTIWSETYGCDTETRYGI